MDLDRLLDELEKQENEEEQNRSIKSCEEDDDKISKSSEKNVEEEASNNVDHSEKEVENGVDAEEERELEELMKSIEIGAIPPTTVSSTQATDNTSEISQKSGVLIDFEVNEKPPPPPIQETTKTEIVETVEEVEKPPIEIVEVEAAPLIDIYDECEDDEAQIQLVVRSLVDRVVAALENDNNGAQNENEQIFSNENQNPKDDNEEENLRELAELAELAELEELEAQLAAENKTVSETRSEPTTETLIDIDPTPTPTPPTTTTREEDITSNRHRSEESASRLEQQLRSSRRSSNPAIQVIDFQTEWSLLSDAERTLGIIAPVWLPDSQTDSCMRCQTKFTFRKRRHHCRACGLIFCSACCNEKLPLPYRVTPSGAASILQSSPAAAAASVSDSPSSNTDEAAKKELFRVCTLCFETINRVNQLKENMNKMSMAQPVASVLKKRPTNTEATNNSGDSEAATTTGGTRLVRTKSVRFSDGYVPGKTAESTDQQPSTSSSSGCCESRRNDVDTESDVQSSENELAADKNASSNAAANNQKTNSSSGRNKHKSSSSKKTKISEKNTHRQSRYIEGELINQMRLFYRLDNRLPPIQSKDEIIDTSNLKAEDYIRIKRKLFVPKVGKCWLITTCGLCTNSQDELVYLLKCTSAELSQQDDDDKDQVVESSEKSSSTETHQLLMPYEILFHIMDVFDKSLMGARIMSMQHAIYDFDAAMLARHAFEENETADEGDQQADRTTCLLENKDNAGFFYFRPSRFHMRVLAPYLKGFDVDHEPFLVGLLVQKWEIPWAKLFPLRLYLRLGEQFEFYPCPLVSERIRKPVYGDIGHTIMSLLCDTRNFQYTIPQIDGLRIRTEGLQTQITIPESQYDFIMKSLLTSNDYVFSLASLHIDDECGSHLVAIENENLGSYSSKTISFEETDNDFSVNKNLIGAAFVVFNGALKSNLTISGRQSTTEDGLMIQIDTEMMGKFKQALRSMKPFRIECSPLAPNDDFVITVEWTKANEFLNRGIKSLVDGRSMQGVKSLRLTNNYDFVNGSKSIRWNEIFLIKEDTDDEERSGGGGARAADESSFNLSRFAEAVSQATCTALAPMLNELAELNHRKYSSHSSSAASAASSSSTDSNNNNPNSQTTKLNWRPFKCALRVDLGRDQVGYLFGMNGQQVLDGQILSRLDNELILLLHQANTNSVSLVVELVFTVQERYNLSGANSKMMQKKK